MLSPSCLLLFLSPLYCATKSPTLPQPSLLEKAKLAREISDGKNKIPPKFLGRKI